MDGEDQPARRRAAGLLRAASLLPRAGRDPASRWASATWDRLVGPTLAAESALVGLDASGTIRVATRNDAARRELLARADAIVATFNAQADALRGRRAVGLACWVAADFYRPQPQVSEAGLAATSARAAPADPVEVDRARREVAAIAPGVEPGLADALARIRARGLARRRGRG